MPNSVPSILRGRHRVTIIAVCSGRAHLIVKAISLMDDRKIQTMYKRPFVCCLYEPSLAVEAAAAVTTDAHKR